MYGRARPDTYSHAGERDAPPLSAGRRGAQAKRCGLRTVAEWTIQNNSYESAVATWGRVEEALQHCLMWINRAPGSVLGTVRALSVDQSEGGTLKGPELRSSRVCRWTPLINGWNGHHRDL